MSKRENRFARPISFHRVRLNRVLIPVDLHEAGRDKQWIISVKFQTSTDVRVRVRESVIRVRIRNTALRTVIRVTPDVQQLHDLLPFRDEILGGEPPITPSLHLCSPRKL